MIFSLDLTPHEPPNSSKMWRNGIINLIYQGRVPYFHLYIFKLFHRYNLILGNYAYRYGEFTLGYIFSMSRNLE